MNYYKMWQALEKRLAKKKDEATDSFQRSLYEQIQELMERLEEQEEKRVYG